MVARAHGAGRGAARQDRALHLIGLHASTEGDRLENLHEHLVAIGRVENRVTHHAQIQPAAVEKLKSSGDEQQPGQHERAVAGLAGPRRLWCRRSHEAEELVGNRGAAGPVGAGLQAIEGP